MNLQYARRSEDTEQIALFIWANANVKKYPELRWLHHIPNGGKRNRQEAVKFKQMGVKAGVSDIFLPFPKGAYCGLYIEMKYGKNKPTETQIEFMKAVSDNYCVEVCYSAKEAAELIERYLRLKGEQLLETPRINKIFYN